MQQRNLDLEAIYLSSFDISCLRTNIPLKEIIQICADTLYNGEFVPLVIFKALFTEKLTSATILVEFSFRHAD